MGAAFPVRIEAPHPHGESWESWESCYGLGTRAVTTLADGFSQV